MDPSPPNATTQPHYGTVTALTFSTAAAKKAAVAGLAELLRGAYDLPGFQDCWVLDTGPTEAVMVTLYASQQAATQASESMRPHVGAVVGAHVTGPPQRWAGDVVAGGHRPDDGTSMTT